MAMLKRKVLSAWMMGVLFVSVLSGVGTMEAGAKDGYFGGGDGSAGDPYIIEDVWDLQNMKGDLDAHYALNSDIDASVTSGWDLGRGFLSVGTSSNMFTGSLDGRNHTITGLYIERIGFSFDSINVGLVGYIGAGGSVKNVGLINCDVTGWEHIGGLVGYNKGTVYNCYTQGTVMGNGYFVEGGAGGLVGYNHEGTVSHCHATGNVSGTYGVGGLVGYNHGTVYKCFATGNVSGTRYYIGGLVGDNHGLVSNCHATGNVDGDEYVGGLVGYNFGTVSSCYATGKVSGEKSLGGLLGANFLTVSNSHYNIDVGLINGKRRTTLGGLYDTQFGDWLSSNLTLNISDYSTSLVPSGGYYNISSVQGIRDLLGFGDVAHYKFRLSADIDLSDAPDLFIPYFGALEFEGNNHTISNLHINVSSSHFGVFGYNNGGAIKNVRVVNASVTGRDNVGGLIGSNLQGSVSNCSAMGYVSGSKNVGGLIGSNNGTVSNCSAMGNESGSVDTGGLVGGNHKGTISNCYATGNVRGFLYTGGLVGYNLGTVSKCHARGDVSGGQFVGGLIGVLGTTVSDCFATGNVSGYYYVGGLVGINFKGMMLNCHSKGSASGFICIGGLAGHNFGTASNCQAKGNVSGYDYVGGLAGFNNGTVSSSDAAGNVSGDRYIGGLSGFNDIGTISNCQAKGNVDGNHSSGGLVGCNNGTVSKCCAEGNVDGIEFTGGLVGLNDHTVSNCYAKGNVGGILGFGGLVGYNNRTVLNCYATGNVSGWQGAGGLVGDNNGTVSNCFWDTNTSGLSSSEGGTGKTTSQMMTCSTFTDAGWDFIAVWCMIENVTYPFLRWQDTEHPKPDAGPDQVVYLDANGRAEVTFNGSASYDDIGILSFVWSFDYNGSSVKLYGEKVEFIFTVQGVYHVTLNITDAVGKRDADTMNVTVLDMTSPLADAGPDLAIDEGTLVTFDGSGSSDNVGIVNWTWTFNDGDPVTLHGPRPSHLFDAPGVFIVTLEVTDAAGHRATDTVTITVNDITPPSADAGSDHVVNEGTLVTFDGSGSSDNVGIVNWTWTFTDGDPFTLHGPRPTHLFDAPGVFVVTLEVTDAAGHRAMDTVTVTVKDITRPSTDAGPDQTVAEGTEVTFDGSGSSDNVGIVNWTWTFIDGDPVTLHGPRPTHLFDAPGVFVVTLEVADAAGHRATDNVTVTVNDITPPSADAGPDQTVDEAALVTLDGSGSFDNVDIANYTWTFTDEDPVTLYGVSPSHRFDDPGVFMVRLSVTDAAGNRHEDTLTITVRDITPPVAVAGDDRSIPVGTTIRLDGSNSTDNVGIDLYTWTLTYGGEPRSLDGAEVNFIFDMAGAYEVVLTITDVAGNTGEDEVVITVVATGRINGTVLGKGGRPVEGATVEVIAADGSLHSTATAADGLFSLEVPHGDFAWKVSKAGFRTVSGNSSVDAMDSTELDFSDLPLVREDEEGSPNLSYLILAIVLVLVLVSAGVVLLLRKVRRAGG